VKLIDNRYSTAAVLPTVKCNLSTCFVSVVILCGSEHFIRDFILSAHQLHMTGGDYVYIVAAQVPPQNVHTPWLTGVHDDEDETARLAFESVLQVRVSRYPISVNIITDVTLLVWSYGEI